MKKYEMTNETINYKGHILHRIKALYDFDNIKAGELGGFIENETNLQQYNNCWLYNDAKAYGYARVSGNGKVYNNAEVYDYGRVEGSAKVYNSAKIGGGVIFGESKVCDNAYIYGRTKVFGRAIIKNNATLSDNTLICGVTIIL